MIVHGADDATVVDFFEKIADLRSPGDEHESYRTLRTWLVRSRPLIRVGGGSQFPQMMAVYAALIHCYNRVSNGHTISRIRVPDEAIKFFSQLPKVGE